MVDKNRKSGGEMSNESEILQRKYESKYFPKVKAVIKAEVDSVISVVQSDGIDSAMRYVMLHVHSKELPIVIQALYQEVGLRFARRQWILSRQQDRGKRKGHIITEMSNKGLSLEFVQTKGFGFNAEWVQFIKDFLYRFLLEKITFQVAESTRNALLAVLNNAIAGGWGITKTVQALDDLPLSSTQAARIVRTEITRAANTGVFAAGSTYDFEQQKVWISALDTRTRGNPITGQSDHANHWSMNGTTIDYEEYFTDPRNGEELLFPGDPSASAESTINCRCNLALVSKVDENGRLIPKTQKVPVMKLSDINRELKEEIKSSFSEILSVVKQEKNATIEAGEKIVSEFSTRLCNEIECVHERIDSSIAKQRESSGNVADELTRIAAASDNIEEKFIGKVDELTDAIRGIKVEPILNVEKTDNTTVLRAVEGVNAGIGEVKNEIGDMKKEIVKEIKELKNKKPANYNVEFNRDGNGFLKSPIKIVAQ